MTSEKYTRIMFERNGIDIHTTMRIWKIVRETHQLIPEVTPNYGNLVMILSLEYVLYNKEHVDWMLL